MFQVPPVHRGKHITDDIIMIITMKKIIIIIIIKNTIMITKIIICVPGPGVALAPTPWVNPP